MADLVQLGSGQVFAGYYQIERRLKAGGMGAVYVVRHTETGKRQALKLMHPDIVSDVSARQRFRQEAQVASLIDEPRHIVDVTHAGVDQESGLPFIVMELLVGCELGELIERKGRLTLDETRDFLKQIARALDRAHAKGVIHRDLKPENLFVVQREEEAPTIKILDFGIAKIIAGTSNRSTMAGGTPLYMAPEQTSRSAQIGPATDIWALGLIVFTALVGSPYWEAEDLNQLYGEVLSGQYESPTERARRRGVVLPAGFDGWFFGCVCREPDRRFSSAGLATQRFIALTEGLGTEPVQTQLAPAPLFVASAGYTVPMLEPPSRSGSSSTGTPLAAAPPRPRGTPRSSRGVFLAGSGVVAVAVAVAGATYGLISKPDPVVPPPKVAAPPESSASAPFGKSQFRQAADKLNPFVDLGDYKLHQHEVTRGEYALFLRASSDKERDGLKPLAGWTDAAEPAHARQPIVWVTHEMAERYCGLLGAALPSSVEWGVAVGAKYPWGDDWPKSLNGVAIGKPEASSPADVETASQDVTKTGIRDLAGNVQEWTSTVADGAATVRGAALNMVAADAQSAIVEGVSKFTAAAAGKMAARESVAGNFVGFRCARR